MSIPHKAQFLFARFCFAGFGTDRKILAAQQACSIPESMPCTGCNGVMTQRIAGGLRCAQCGAQWPPPGSQPRIRILPAVASVPRDVFVRTLLRKPFLCLSGKKTAKSHIPSGLRKDYLALNSA